MIVDQLNQFQVSGLLGLGAVFWGVAAAVIRRSGPVMFANDVRRVAFFISAPPIAYVAIRFSEVLLGVDPSKRLISVSVMLGTALFLDGIAFMWFPSLYENPSLQKKNPASAVAFSRMGAAWILWGVGTFLIISLLT